MARKPKADFESPYKLSAWRAAHGLTYEQVGEALGMTGQNYGKIERGSVELREFHLGPLAQLYGVEVGDLTKLPDQILAPIVGHVGADPEGRIVRTLVQAANDHVPLPIGATSNCVAVQVDGHSMRGFADDGSLIFYENLETPPSDDLIGEKVVVQLAGDDEADDPDVLIKILRRGSKPGLYDLESINGPTMKDVRVRWAAEIIQITPPRQARRLIRHGLA